MDRSCVDYAEETVCNDKDCCGHDDLTYEDKVAVYQGERLAIRDDGPGEKISRKSLPGRQSQKPSAYFTKTSETANHHAKFNLQTSLWRTFQEPALPTIDTYTRPPSRRDDSVPPNRYHEDEDSEESYNKAMLEQDNYEINHRNIVARITKKGKWQRAWHDVVQEGTYAPRNTHNEDTNKSTMAQSTSRSSKKRRPPRVFQLPPTPGPLAPCLQCALAGACCSLTAMPYAKTFVNDRVSTRRPRRSRMVATAEPSWEDALADLKKNLEKKCRNSDAYNAKLPWKQQQLEQKMLRQAIVRGNTDSPFLPQPPVQCIRCARMGETACLQQSTDLTNTVSAAGGKEKAVAWFASSGPPPLSLLPQHGTSLLDQIRYGPDYQTTVRPVPRSRAHNPPPLALEAIFCRNPYALTAAGVAAKARDLLEQIGKKYTRGSSTGSRYSQRSRQQDNKVVSSTHVRPATAIEVSRQLPRRSWLNVYAGRGVATVKPLVISVEKRDGSQVQTTAFGLSDYRSVPPALPSWHAKDRQPAVVNSKKKKTNHMWLEDEDPALPPARHNINWQDYFTSRNEATAAALFPAQKSRIKKCKRAKSLSILPTIPPSPTATLSRPVRERPAVAKASSQNQKKPEPKPETKEQREARIARMAIALSNKVRDEQQRILGEADPARRIKAVPVGSKQQSQLPFSLEDELAIDDLIRRLSRSFNIDTSKRMATLAVGPGRGRF